MIPTPETIRGEIEQMRQILDRLEESYPSAYGLAYSTSVHESAGKVSAGPSDPTGTIALGREPLRQLVGKVAGNVLGALESLKRADGHLLRAFRPPKEPAAEPLEPSTITGAELDESASAARRRHARGETDTGRGEIGTPSTGSGRP